METNTHVFFWKSDSPFSHWYRKPGVIQFIHQGINFECAEQAMMYKKAELMQDLKSMELILKTPDPEIVKGLGRGVKNFDQERWDENKEDIVFNINISKFSQNKDLLDILATTEGKILVEASPYDKIWGAGLAIGDKNILFPARWRGQNLLGYILTDVRRELIGCD